MMYIYTIIAAGQEVCTCIKYFSYSVFFLLNKLIYLFKFVIVLKPVNPCT